MAYFLVFSLPVSADIKRHKSMWQAHIDFYHQELINQLQERNDILHYYNESNFQRIADFMIFEAVLNPLTIDMPFPTDLHLPNIIEAVDNGLMYMEAVESQYAVLQNS